MQYNQYNVLISLQNYTVPSVLFVLSNKLTKMPSYELFDNIYIQVAKLMKTTHLFLTELQFLKEIKQSYLCMLNYFVAVFVFN